MTSRPTSYRDVSLWLDTVDDELVPRTPLPGDIQVDIAIVGGGYTGLWTAYYLKRADPKLRIAIVEKEICGFGASGRNGGWCSALFAGSRKTTAKNHGRDAAVALQREMFNTVDEVGRVAASEGIDCDFVKGGTLTFATQPVHVERIKGYVEEEHSWGFGPEDMTWLSPEAAGSRIDLAGNLGAAFTPHCARIHPGKLVRGLARVVDGLGVEIYERTAAAGIEERVVRTDRGTITADVVVQATEGYTTTLPGQKRRMVPIYSLMIATEPLPQSFWDRAGWSGRETLTDGRHLIIYAQRTADDRIAFGGRGAPYHFGSSIKAAHDSEPEVFDELERTVHQLFPGTVGAAITHRWGGPIGVPRDWYSSVGYDRSRGFAWAGGYVGDGVSTTNLAGRTLADLILGVDSDITRLAWVDHHSRNWEPEPLRWIGANLALWTMGSADRREKRTGKPSKLADAVAKYLIRSPI
ncbi:MAG: FAD-dependent oxidoreductase [Actinobacteria bacterium]|nr:FAD-dependent oxidoreductase [Actinomycetota bacterium]